MFQISGYAIDTCMSASDRPPSWSSGSNVMLGFQSHTHNLGRLLSTFRSSLTVPTFNTAVGYFCCQKKIRNINFSPNYFFCCYSRRKWLQEIHSGPTPTHPEDYLSPIQIISSVAVFTRRLAWPMTQIRVRFSFFSPVNSEKEGQLQ